MAVDALNKSNSSTNSQSSNKEDLKPADVSKVPIERSESAVLQPIWDKVRLDGSKVSNGTISSSNDLAVGLAEWNKIKTTILL